jgi:hypothetical protein
MLGFWREDVQHRSRGREKARSDRQIKSSALCMQISQERCSISNVPQAVKIKTKYPLFAPLKYYCFFGIIPEEPRNDLKFLSIKIWALSDTAIDEQQFPLLYYRGIGDLHSGAAKVQIALQLVLLEE